MKSSLVWLDVELGGSEVDDHEEVDCSDGTSVRHTNSSRIGNRTAARSPSDYTRSTIIGHWRVWLS